MKFNIRINKNINEALDNNQQADLNGAIYNAVSDAIFESGYLDVDERSVRTAFDRFIKKFFLDESMKEDLTVTDFEEKSNCENESLDNNSSVIPSPWNTVYDIFDDYQDDDDYVLDELDLLGYTYDKIIPVAAKDEYQGILNIDGELDYGYLGSRDGEWYYLFVYGNPTRVLEYSFDDITKHLKEFSMNEDLEKESDYIIWYNLDGEEDYEIISAISVDDAKEKFSKNLDPSLIIDVHEIADDENIHNESLKENNFGSEGATNDDAYEEAKKIFEEELGLILPKDIFNLILRVNGIASDMEVDESLNESETNPGWEDPAWRKYFGVDDDSFYDEQEEIIEPEDVEDIYSLNDLDD